MNQFVTSHSSSLSTWTTLNWRRTGLTSEQSESAGCVKRCTSSTWHQTLECESPFKIFKETCESEDIHISYKIWVYIFSQKQYFLYTLIDTSKGMRHQICNNIIYSYLPVIQINKTDSNKRSVCVCVCVSSMGKIEYTVCTIKYTVVYSNI